VQYFKSKGGKEKKGVELILRLSEKEMVPTLSTKKTPSTTAGGGNAHYYTKKDLLIGKGCSWNQEGGGVT